MNIKRFINKGLSRSLSSKIDFQKSWHRRNNVHMYNSIMVSVSSDHSGPHISATLWSDDSDRFNDVRAIIFFKCPIDSFIEGVNQITVEVTKAKNRHPELYFFRKTILMKEDFEEYISRLKAGGDALCSPRIEEMLNKGNINSFKNKKKTNDIYEIYSNGSWSITDKEPWIEHQSGYDLE